MCPYTCRSFFFCTLSFFDQLPTSRDDEQESLTDAAHTYTTQQEEQARWNGEEKKRWQTRHRRSSPARNQGKENDHGTERGSVYISWLSDLVSPARLHCHVGDVASNRTELSLLPRRRSHAMISSGIATNRVRFWNTTQRLTKELNRQQKRRTESDFKTACRSAHVLADNDVLKILPGKQAK